MNETILVVDDEQEIADLVAVYLKNEGYRVQLCGTAAAALACIETNKPDLAILDVMLPDMDGFSLCRRIRQQHLFPIVMLTARVEDMDKITGLSLGADDYITKHAGSASLTGFSTARTRHRAQVAVALYQKFTGQGIGTALLEELVGIARKKGLEQLELEVAAHNTGAIALYKKLGFEVCGVLPRNMKYPDGSYEDVLYMAKPLGEESAE